MELDYRLFVFNDILNDINDELALMEHNQGKSSIGLLPNTIIEDLKETSKQLLSLKNKLYHIDRLFNKEITIEKYMEKYDKI